LNDGVFQEFPSKAVVLLFVEGMLHEIQRYAEPWNKGSGKVIGGFTYPDRSHVFNMPCVDWLSQTWRILFCKKQGMGWRHMQTEKNFHMSKPINVLTKKNGIVKLMV
tara:strand:+ start:526 stop:846 length:321 start_codon:yes stop_codon:yes gene_type:complete